MPESVKIFGILNITEDSFSDGGKFLESESAIGHAQSLKEGGAEVIDIGAQSSNVHASPVSEDLEIQRLDSVWSGIQELGVEISIDTFRSKVIRYSIQRGANFINNIQGFSESDLEFLGSGKFSNTKLISMFSQNQGEKALTESDLTTENVMDRICGFFDSQLALAKKHSIQKERIVLDPGMGFFLSPDYRVSFEVLRNISQLVKTYGQIMVCVSRKSFIGNFLDGLPVELRDAPTLTLEDYLVSQGVRFIRTHNPRALSQAIRIRNYLAPVL